LRAGVEEAALLAAV
jgi:heme-degrading monooxygenase HmoA